MARQNATTRLGSPKPEPLTVAFVEEQQQHQGSIHSPRTAAAGVSGGLKPTFSGIPTVGSDDLSPSGDVQAGNKRFSSGHRLHHVSTIPALPIAVEEEERARDQKHTHPVSAASVSMLSATQPKQTWGQWAYSGLSWAGSKLPFAARVFNVFFYAMVVTAVFVLLAIQRANGSIPWAITYGVTSAVYNWPMAIAFNEKLVKFFQGLMGKPLPYKLSFAAGLLMAVETTIAGLAVAQDGVNKVGKDLPSSLVYYGIVTFLINTFATRSVGATNFLYGTYNDICELVSKVFLGKNAFYNLADDLKRYGDQVKDEMILGAGSQETFVSLFYKKLAEKNLSPNKTAFERLTQVLNFAAVNLPRALAFFLLPMWLGLAQKGWETTGTLFGRPALADSDALVYTSALSSWLFYMRGAGMFAPNTVKFVHAANNRLEELFKNLSPSVAKGARYLVLGAGLVLIVFTSGCSGSGFALVIHGQLHPDNATRPYQGFGSSAEKLFMVVVPFEWAFRHFIAPMGGYSALVPSGVLINGGTVEEFVADCLKIQDDYGCTLWQAVEKKMFGVEPPARSVIGSGGGHTAVLVEREDQRVESPRERDSVTRDEGVAVVRSRGASPVQSPTRDEALRSEQAGGATPLPPEKSAFDKWRDMVAKAVEERDFEKIDASAKEIRESRSRWTGDQRCCNFFGTKDRRTEEDYLSRPINTTGDAVRVQQYGSMA